MLQTLKSQNLRKSFSQASHFPALPEYVKVRTGKESLDMNRKQKARLSACFCKNTRLDRNLLLLYRQLCCVKGWICRDCRCSGKKSSKK